MRCTTPTGSRFVSHGRIIRARGAGDLSSTLPYASIHRSAWKGYSQKFGAHPRDSPYGGCAKPARGASCSVVVRDSPLLGRAGGKEEIGRMRFMITCRIPMDRGNELAKNGTLGETIKTIMEELQPEAAYFSDIDGARGGYIVVEMEDASQIPAMAEPLFLGLGATILVNEVMTTEDLAKGTPAIEQAAQKYG